MIINEDHPLLFDGAMGTMYNTLTEKPSENVEMACLEQPELIRQIHENYIQAGARAIKTNTFGISAALETGEVIRSEQILKAACRIAKEAVKNSRKDVRIFGDIGPLSLSNHHQSAPIYIEQANTLYQNGIRHFLCETLADDTGLAELAAWLDSQEEETFLICSFALGPDGITKSGQEGSSLLLKTQDLPGVGAVGCNCVCGPHHLLSLMQNLPKLEKPLSIMPNAGYPTILGRKVVYDGKPDYFGRLMASIYQSGAVILGGCCGTTPEHISEMIRQVELAGAMKKEKEIQPKKPLVQGEAFSDTLWSKLESNRKVAAVELDPPKNDRIAGFMHNVSYLAKHGADFVTIADCPIGRPRADSCLLACKVKRELGIDALPHMTCRDRNLNATKALLLGLSMEDLHSILLVTGDPIPSEMRDEVKSVFSFNSRMLAKYISSLQEDTLSTPFHMFGALNVNAPNFDVQLRMAKEKEENGIQGFLTQPVHSKRALDNLARARQELNGKLLGGLFPIVSARNAAFLNNEVNGMDVCEEIAALYQGKNRQEAEEVAVKICLETARAMQDIVDGYYIITPFSRVELIGRLLEAMKKEKLIGW